MITGRCECGRVKFQVDGEIKDFSHCHCSQCRRLHGAAFATFAGVAVKDFSYLSGEDELSIYQSSPSHDRGFCKNCGSNIFCSVDDEPEMLYLAMGAIDGNPQHPPEYHIFVGSKAHWFTITDSFKQHDTFPE